MDVFDNLPISALINGKFLALHGGISPELKSIKDLNKVDRFREPPNNGLFCDLLWADPIDNPSGKLNDNFVYNEDRRCSYKYGVKAISKFLD